MYANRLQHMLERHRAPGAAVLVALFSLTLTATTATAQAPDPQAEINALRDRVAALETALASLRAEFDSRLVALEQERTAPAPAVAQEAAGAQQPSAEDAERAALERELAALLGEGGDDTAPTAAAPPAPPEASDQRFSGKSRNLNMLNPEISVAGDMTGNVANRTGDPEANQFRYDEFEISLQSTLDPYSLAKAFVVQEGGSFSVEEAYVDYTSLPGRLGLKVGAFRNDWGKLNRWHTHGLPQVDRPFVHQAIWGEEGLKGLGVGLSWLPPAFLGSYNEINVQVTNDENAVSFSGRGFDNPVFMVHETNYFDLGNASYLELGLSAATGVNDAAGEFRTQVYGADLNYSWVPPARSMYRGFELRGEVLLQRKNSGSGREDVWGAYAYGTYKLDRRWSVGVRGDWTQIPGEPEARLWGVSPYVEWWQSEWAQLRFQYSHNSRQLLSPDSENRFFFQIVWAIGPHKHEKY